MRGEVPGRDARDPRNDPSESFPPVDFIYTTACQGLGVLDESKRSGAAGVTPCHLELFRGGGDGHLLRGRGVPCSVPG